jgi:type VI secretion system protein VasD
MNSHSIMKYLVSVAAGLALGLAAAHAEGKETKLKSEVVAAENINPSRRGTPQPVKIHIFYLAEDDAFLQGNFTDLADPESAVLGDELVRRAKQLIGPGDVLALDEAFDEAAKFIGVIAEFTDLDQASWRAIAPVPARRWTDVLKLFKNGKLQILVDGITISCAIVEE